MKRHRTKLGHLYDPNTIDGVRGLLLYALHDWDLLWGRLYIPTLARPKLTPEERALLIRDIWYANQRIQRLERRIQQLFLAMLREHIARQTICEIYATKR